MPSPRGPLVENSPFVLAAERTARRDPMDGYKLYTGGWNISETHYWAVSSSSLELTGFICRLICSVRLYISHASSKSVTVCWLYRLSRIYHRLCMAWGLWGGLVFFVLLLLLLRSKILLLFSHSICLLSYSPHSIHLCGNVCLFLCSITISVLELFHYESIAHFCS